MCLGECRVWDATRLECKGSVSTVADAMAAQAVLFKAAATDAFSAAT